MSGSPASTDNVPQNFATVAEPNDYLPPRLEMSDQTIPSRFREVCSLFPDNVAMAGDGPALTYVQLDLESDRIATKLTQMGIRTGERVAVVGHTAISTVVSLLAALKSGAVVVPIDPSYPIERNRYIVEDAEARIVLTIEVHSEMVTAIGFTADQVLITNAGNCEQEFGSIHFPDGKPDDVAWLIYTSGSTGKPKGVALTHASMLQVCARRTRMQKIAPSDRLALLYSCSVHGALNNLWSALMNGARLYPWELRSRGLLGLYEWLDENAVTVYHSVPSVFRKFSELSSDRGPLDHLRVITLGGESSTLQDLDRALKLLPDNGCFINALGSSETGSIAASVFNHFVRPRGSVLPAGKPLEGIRIEVTDQDGRTVPVGETGEIRAFGKSFAAGYWKDSETTASKFFTTTQRTGFTGYRMGDRGRLDDKGILWYLGREDNQVKIRGYRVEIPEIESTLLKEALPAELAVVAPLVSEEHERRLVLYVVPGSGEGALGTVEAFHQCCVKFLPPNMVPEDIVLCQELPKTPTGKVDRKRLLSEAEKRTTPENPAVPDKPSSASLIDRLIHLWNQVLKKSDSNKDSDFFIEGGNSLMAMELLVKLKSLTGKAVSFGQFVQAPTPAQLQHCLESGELGEENTLIPLRKEGQGTPLFCVPPWNGTLLFYKQLSACLKEGFPVYGLEVKTDETGIIRVNSVAEIVDLHLKTIEQTWPEGPIHLLGYSSGVCLAWEIAGQLQAKGRQIVFLGNIDDLYPGNQHASDSANRSLRLVKRFLRHPIEMSDLYFRLSVKRLSPASRHPGDKVRSERIAAIMAVKEQVMNAYQPQPANIPMTVFKARRQWRSAAIAARNLNWECCTQDIRTIGVPGDHHSIVSGKHVPDLASAIGKALPPDLQ